MRNMILAAIAALVLATLAYFAFQPASTPPAATSTASSAAQSSPPIAPRSGELTASTPPTTKPATDALRFLRLLIDPNSEANEVCLIFSAPLQSGERVRYADYVRLEPAIKVDVRIEEARLCMSGLSFGVEYQLELLAGLPAKDGLKLGDSVQLPISLGDRKPSVRLGAGFVLPMDNDEGLPVTTMNVDKLNLKLFRVGDRLLARMREDFVDERTMYSYDAERMAEDEGRLVWSGSMALKAQRNNAQTSLIPIKEAIGKREPGAYLLVAGDAADETAIASEEDYYYDEERGRMAAQWIVQSDLGLTSLRGADGLSVVARSLRDATAQAGVRLTLIARNNDILGEASTDANGVARFPAGLLQGTGGMAAVMLMAYARDDFNFLDLRRAAFDLSDRGVEGRAPSGPVDAFLYTERGIYRPGETVHLTALARDAVAKSINNSTLILKLLRPNGQEARRYTLKAQGEGGAALDVPLPLTAARGGWEITAHTDPEAAPVGRVSFEVQDFVPQRLALTILDKPKVLAAGDAFSIPIEARFLYGAPAASLGGEGDLILETDPAPFPMHKGFHWGNEDEVFQGERVSLEVGETDAAGKTTVTGSVPSTIQSSRPLRADIALAVREPGGRATGEHVFVPVRVQPLALGLRPVFEGAAKQGADAGFELIAVDNNGTRVAQRGLEYRFIKDESTWQWHRRNNQWRYERVVRERELASGTLDVIADKPALLKQQVSWGSYRVMVRDPVSGANSALRFYGGWYGEATAERPDRLPIAADKAGYAPGETAKLRIDSEFAGQALIVMANERVHEVRNISVPAGGVDVEIPVRAEWGAGAYALVTLYRPMRDKLGHAPVRAVGVAWLGLNPLERTLKVAIDAPSKIAPRQKIDVPVTISGMTAGSKAAYVTLAAVDQGILQLTRFKTPAPQAHYLSKRQLGVGMRDDYGRLIRGLNAGGDDQGGDADGGKGLDVVPTRTVALFSGLVKTDAQGKALIPLDVPDFQGELRLMAVAFDAEKMGSGDMRMTVRDPLVAELILPRFLAPSDEGRLTVLLHNVEGAAGAYTLKISASGTVSGGESPILAERSIQLAAGAREVFTLPLRALDAGIGQVVMNLNGPAQADGKPFAVTRDWPIQVRPPQAVQSIDSTELLAAGQAVTLDDSLLTGFIPGTGAVALSISRYAGLDVPGLLRWMDRYPFGCLEQTTSRAMPLLYFNEMAKVSGVREDRTLDMRVQVAIDHVLAMQQTTGGFNMWGPWGTYADPWISVFALDFLLRAADKGFDVPQAPRQLGQQWLSGEAMRDSRADVRAYAAALLARLGRVNASDLRYFHDQNPPSDPVGWAHLGSALESIGERARANHSFNAAKELLAKPESYKPAPYGSPLRDVYAVAAIMAQAGRSASVPSILAFAPQRATLASRYGLDYTTTQEKAWMLLAAADIGHNAGKIAVEVNGVPVPKGDPAVVKIEPAQLAGTRLNNVGESEVFRILSVEGVPREPLPAMSEGMRLHKQVYSLDGQPVDVSSLPRNERFVVVIEGESLPRAGGDYAVLDLLPAGWEIEGMLRPEQAGYAWLGELSEAQMRQARDDRYLAAISLPNYVMDRTDPDYPSRDYSKEIWSFKLAYVVRAVTPGHFALPAASAEHMYAPRIRARTAMGTMTIVE
ncbi:MAG: alpha-2-macroglobulin [Halothiobacillaceae bacterium]|nr:alpha-2-macroglobulin [Halothiobacillaceae bacterium]